MIDEVPRKSIAVRDKMKIVHANDDEGVCRECLNQKLGKLF